MTLISENINHPVEGAGALYVHVPFCPKVCHYCDFAVLKAGEKHHEAWWEMVQIELEAKFPPREGGPYSWDTIYFGGGTPSLLGVSLWNRILQYFHKRFDLKRLREMTIEVNPETLTDDRLQLWTSWGVNRVSMGIQTFQNTILRTLGRSCDSDTNHRALQLLQAGKMNYSADLMFGLPGQSLEMFLDDLETVLSYRPTHMSFYGLTIEEGTLFDQWLKQGKIKVEDEIQTKMYEQGVDILERHGLQRYELSNFARVGFEGIHNTKYWNNQNYCGVGPGAHSYDGHERKWNHKHLSKWSRSIRGISPSGEDPSFYADKEKIGPSERLYEYLWLSLRQTKGISTLKLKKGFDFKIPPSILDKWSHHLLISENRISLCGEGWFLIDEIIIDMMNSTN